MDMAKHIYDSPTLAKVAERQQHFGIRKLTIGAASVLLGTTLWLSGKANVVRADVQTDNNNETPHEATQSSQSTPEINENTKVEVEVPTENENVNSVANEATDSISPSDSEDQQQSSQTDLMVKNQAVNGAQQEDQKAQSVGQVSTQEDRQITSSINNINQHAQRFSENKNENNESQTAVTDIDESMNNSQSNLSDLSTKKTSQNDFSTEQNNRLNLKNGSSSKFNTNLKNLYNQSKVQSDNTNNGGFDKATWGTLDANDWYTQDDGTYLELIGYKGDYNHIIVPNAADFENAGLDSNDKPVGVTSTLMHSLFLKADSKNATVAFSRTNDQKIQAMDNDWSDVWAHEEEKPTHAILNNFDGNSLDTSQITNMDDMFSDNQITDLSSLAGWNTSNVTDMSGMFSGNEIIDLTSLSNWDTSNITDMSDMFVGNQINDLAPLSGWDTHNVTDMSDMFSYNQINDLTPLANWDIGNVIDMHRMFNSNKITDLTGLKKWNISDVTNMDNMFSDNQINDLNPLADWNTESVNSMINMFLLNPITKADLSKWNFTNIGEFQDDNEDIAGDFSGLQGFIDSKDKATINLGNNDTLPNWFLSQTVTNDQNEKYSNENIFTSNKGNNLILTSNPTLLANPNKAYNTLTFSNGDTATFPVFIDATPTTALNTVKSMVDEKIIAEKNKLGNNYTVTIDPSVDQTDPIALANAKFNVTSIPVVPEDPSSPVPAEQGTINIAFHDDTDNKNIPNVGYNSGQQDVDTPVTYTPAIDIQKLENQGYDYVEMDGRIPNSIKSGSTSVVIHMKHGIISVNPDNPGRPGQPINSNNPAGPKWPIDTNIQNLTKMVTRTIHYIGAGANTPKDVTQSVNFARSGVLDKVTGQWITPLTWSADQSIANVTSPIIAGYHIINVDHDSNGTNVAAATITPATSDYEVNVIYARDEAPVINNQNAVLRVVDNNDPGHQVELSRFNDSDKAGNVIVFADSQRVLDNYIKEGYTFQSASNDATNVSIGTAINNLTYGNYDNDDQTTQSFTVYLTHTTTDVSATDPQAVKTIKRTITVTNPDDSKRDMSQTIQLHRSATRDNVTSLTSYGNWNTGHFDAVTIPVIAGYTASQATVPAVANVTVDYHDPNIQVAYSKNGDNSTTEVVNYIDATTHQQVGNEILHGKVGQAISFVPAVPDGYDLQKGGQVQISFTSGNTNTTDVPVVEHISTIDPDNVTIYKPIWGNKLHGDQAATVLPGTKQKHIINDVTYSDLHSARTRTIAIVNPDGTLNSKTVVQQVMFKRPAIINAVTGTVTFGNWIPDGNDSFAQVTVPQFSGYTATQTEVPELDHVSASYHDSNITIRYYGNANIQTINYVNSQGKIIGKQTLSGNNGQNVTVTSEVPDGWQVVENQSVPTQVTLQPQNKPLTIKLAPVTQTVNPDQVTVSAPITAGSVITGTKNKHLQQDITYKDLHKDVTRTVKITLPNDPSNPVLTTQTVHFVRTATVDAPTGKVTYSAWKQEGATKLAAVTAPIISGYKATTQAPTMTVNSNTSNSTVAINYVPNEQKQAIVYKDEQGNIVSQQEVTGKTDQTVNTNLKVPDGYELDPASEAPAQVTMTVTNKPITVVVTPKETVVKASDVTPDKSISKNTIISGTTTKHLNQGISYNDLNKDVSRQIIVTLPNGQQQAVTQTVKFERDAKINDATGRVSFSNWQANGQDKFDKLNLPTINGYLPTSTVSEVEGVTDDGQPQVLKINYVPDTAANRAQIAQANIASLKQAQSQVAAKLAKLNQAQDKAKQQKQDTQTAIQKQTLLVQNLQKKVNDTQSLLQSLYADQNKAQVKADQADNVVNDLTSQIKDRKQQNKDAGQRLVAETKQLTQDQNVADQIKEQLQSINDQIKKIQAINPEAPASTSSNTDVEFSMIPMTKELSAALAQYGKDVQSYYKKTHDLYKKTYEINYGKFNPGTAKKDAQSNALYAVFNDSKDTDVFLNNMNTDGKAILDILKSDYNKPQTWNTQDANNHVDLSNNLRNITAAQRKEIEDYTFNLYNTIRGKIGLPTLTHSTQVENMAHKIADAYLNAGRTIFDGQGHDVADINRIANDEFGLKDTNSSAYQRYESMDGWYSNMNLGFAPIDNTDSVQPISIAGLDSDSNVTNMDAIKQGIFADMIQMLIADNTGGNDWGHTLALLSLGTMGDYVENPQYFFGNAISTLEDPLQCTITNADGAYTYTHHLINVSTSNLKLGSPIKADSDQGQQMQIQDPAQAINDKQAALTKLEEKRTNLLQRQQKNKDQIESDNDAIKATQHLIDLNNQFIKAYQPTLDKALQDQKAAHADLDKKKQEVQAQEVKVKQAKEEFQKQQTILDEMEHKGEETNNVAKSLDNKLVQIKSEAERIDNELKFTGNSSQSKPDQGQLTNGSQGVSQAPTVTQSGTTTSTNSNTNSTVAVQNTSSPTSDGNSDTSNKSETDNTSDEDSDTEDGASPVTRSGGSQSFGKSSQNAVSNSLARRNSVHYGPSYVTSPRATAMKGIRHEARKSGYLQVSTVGQLGDQGQQNILPQTGEDTDSIIAALMGGATIAIGLIGLAGIKRKES